MATLSAIQKQIEKLTAEAERLKKKESQEAIAKIRESIAQYGLTPDDLFGPVRGGRGKAGAPAVSGKTARERAGRGVPGVAKYRDPDTGATWTGTGRAPAWIAGVADRSTYLIDGDARPTGAVSADKPRRSPRKAKVSRAAAPAKKSKAKGTATKKVAAKPVQAVAKKAARKKASAGNGATQQRLVKRSNRKPIKAVSESQGALLEGTGDAALA